MMTVIFLIGELTRTVGFPAPPPFGIVPFPVRLRGFAKPVLLAAHYF